MKRKLICFLYLKQFITYIVHDIKMYKILNKFKHFYMCGYTFCFWPPTHQNIITLPLNNQILNIYLVVNDFATILMKNIVKHLSYFLVSSSLTLYIYIRKKKSRQLRGKKAILICVKVVTCNTYIKVHLMYLKCNL